MQSDGRPAESDMQDLMDTIQRSRRRDRIVFFAIGLLAAIALSAGIGAAILL